MGHRIYSVFSCTVQRISKNIFLTFCLESQWGTGAQWGTFCIAQTIGMFTQSLFSARAFPPSFFLSACCLLHNFSDLDDLGVQVAAHFTDLTHIHTLFNLPFTQSLLGRSATMCCSFQSMNAKGSKSWIKVQHGTPFCMLPALHLIKVQTEKPKHLHVYDGPRKL